MRVLNAGLLHQVRQLERSSSAPALWGGGGYSSISQPSLKLWLLKEIDIRDDVVETYAELFFVF